MKFTEAIPGLVEEKSEPVNTNNAWGFGGRLGVNTHYTLDGTAIIHETGKACFRHLPSVGISRVRVEGIRKPFIAKFFVKLYKQGGLQAVREYVKEQERN